MTDRDRILSLFDAMQDIIHITRIDFMENKSNPEVKIALRILYIAKNEVMPMMTITEFYNLSGVSLLKFEIEYREGITELEILLAERVISRYRGLCTEFNRGERAEMRYSNRNYKLGIA